MLDKRRLCRCHNIVLFLNLFFFSARNLGEKRQADDVIRALARYNKSHLLVAISLHKWRNRMTKIWKPHHVTLGPQCSSVLTATEFCRYQLSICQQRKSTTRAYPHPRLTITDAFNTQILRCVPLPNRSQLRRWRVFRPISNARENIQPRVTAYVFLVIAMRYRSWLLNDPKTLPFKRELHGQFFSWVNIKTQQDQVCLLVRTNKLYVN